MNLKEFLALNLINILKYNDHGTCAEGIWIVQYPDGTLTISNHQIENTNALGGEVPPALTTHGGKIFRPKIYEVISYIQSFGLSQDVAEFIVDQVGIFP